MKLGEEFHLIDSVLSSHESVYLRLVLKMGSLQFNPLSLNGEATV